MDESIEVRYLKNKFNEEIDAMSGGIGGGAYIWLRVIVAVRVYC